MLEVDRSAVVSFVARLYFRARVTRNGTRKDRPKEELWFAALRLRRLESFRNKLPNDVDASVVNGMAWPWILE